MRAWLGWVKIHRETVPASLLFHHLWAKEGVGYFKGPPEAWEAMGPEGFQFASCFTASQLWNLGQSPSLPQPVSPSAKWVRLRLSDLGEPHHSLRT